MQYCWYTALAQLEMMWTHVLNDVLCAAMQFTSACL